MVEILKLFTTVHGTAPKAQHPVLIQPCYDVIRAVSSVSTVTMCIAKVGCTVATVSSTTSRNSPPKTLALALAGIAIVEKRP